MQISYLIIRKCFFIVLCKSIPNIIGKTMSEKSARRRIAEETETAGSQCELVIKLTITHKSTHMYIHTHITCPPSTFPFEELDIDFPQDGSRSPKFRSKVKPLFLLFLLFPLGSPRRTLCFFITSVVTLPQLDA